MQHGHLRDVKCFKCLGHRHIAMEYLVDGKLIVVKRSFNIHASDDEQQRENIFHTWCHIQGKVCSVIIDGGSCNSPFFCGVGIPYKLQWLNDGGEIKVPKQAIIPFSIGKYSDEVLYDVVSMHGGHLLLGRPLKYDRQMIRLKEKCEKSKAKEKEKNVESEQEKRNKKKKESEVRSRESNMRKEERVFEKVSFYANKRA
ncbi:putative LRR receptor-like serine/threonine-protein kinase [Gossypium australe]|uniref:Putative LRR receptor-like serine/threonine-protein kinase n=1 Tax=Gossypium australe TaxID=47621 RepID=A0A5B6W7A0_9ROSI|nr:putative LRR receptor-like serine/threonine-protein kinase [Gossypium australe]